MKNKVLFYGLISGLIITVMMVVTTIMCYKNPNFKGSMILGFSTMIFAFAFIFVAIKEHRDKQNGGLISFKQAFKIGLYISLIASTMYVAVWLIEYYILFPDFMEKYSAHLLKEARADGATAEDILRRTKEINQQKQMYTNPLMVVLITYLEVFPIGLIITILSALILRNTPKTL